jgi:hypothetical protein
LEARRLLRSDGIALISVPYLNPLRKAYLKMIDDSALCPNHMHFHQYYYDIDSFSDTLLQAGLKTIKWYPYGVEAFLIREHPVFSRVWKLAFMPYRFQKLLLHFMRNAPISVRRRFGHMVLFVAQPI